MRGLTCKSYLLFPFFLVLFFSIATAQKVKITGRFLSDSIKIGEVVPFAVGVHYPKEVNVLFPDSTFTFLPFEFSSKKFFPTQTSNNTSYDSVVYYLTTFEIDPVQILSLPVFVTTAKDCLAYTSVPDSLFLIELVKTPPSDSVAASDLPLKTNTLYEKVFSELNYVILLIVATALAVLALVSWILFGKRIIRYFKSKKLLQHHKSFVEKFNANVHELSIAFSPEQTEQTLSLWKKYMEQLELRPYTKLTTRETVAMLPDGVLKNNLQLLDKAIYGNQTAVIEPLKGLQKVAEEHFTQKLESIKNG